MSNAGVPVRISLRVEAETAEAREWAMDKAVRALVAAGFDDLDAPPRPTLTLVKEAAS